MTQWLSSAFGGYLTGRLRTKWVGVRTDEVLFRDTAHGLLAWALATLLMAALLTIGSAVTAGVAAWLWAGSPEHWRTGTLMWAHLADCPLGPAVPCLLFK